MITVDDEACTVYYILYNETCTFVFGGLFSQLSLQTGAVGLTGATTKCKSWPHKWMSLVSIYIEQYLQDKLPT